MARIIMVRSFWLRPKYFSSISTGKVYPKGKKRSEKLDTSFNLPSSSLDNISNCSFLLCKENTPVSSVLFLDSAWLKGV